MRSRRVPSSGVRDAAGPGPTDTGVRAVFDAAPPIVRARLLELRALIHATAASIDGVDGVGALEETLKWGEPAWLTPSGSGTTIRLGWKPSAPDEIRVLVHCSTDLVDRFRGLCPELRCEGNRAIVLHTEGPLPTAALERCIALALTHHRTARARRRHR